MAYCHVLISVPNLSMMLADFGTGNFEKLPLDANKMGYLKSYMSNRII